MSTEPPLEHPEPENARPPNDTWRVLFLDSPDHVEVLKEACKDAGYVVVGATTIEDALAFLDGKDHVDVIVCAAHLEEESMFAFLRTVRDHERHGSAKFLILSLEATAIATRLERSTASAGMALGADSYSTMPVFDAVELVARIKQLQPVVPMLQQSATLAEKRNAE